MNTYLLWPPLPMNTRNKIGHFCVGMKNSLKQVQREGEETTKQHTPFRISSETGSSIMHSSAVPSTGLNANLLEWGTTCKIRVLIASKGKCM